MSENKELKLIASQKFHENEELYSVVDFLNKALKDKNVIFGIRKDGDKRIITIYEA